MTQTFQEIPSPVDGSRPCQDVHTTVTINTAHFLLTALRSMLVHLEPYIEESL